MDGWKPSVFGQKGVCFCAYVAIVYSPWHTAALFVTRLLQINPRRITQGARVCIRVYVHPGD